MRIQIPTGRTNGTRTRATQMLTYKFVEICSTPLTTAPRRPFINMYRLLNVYLNTRGDFPPVRMLFTPNLPYSESKFTHLLVTIILIAGGFQIGAMQDCPILRSGKWNLAIFVCGIRDGGILGFETEVVQCFFFFIGADPRGTIATYISYQIPNTKYQIPNTKVYKFLKHVYSMGTAYNLLQVRHINMSWISSKQAI